jgi:hypothetical protein
MKKYLLSLLFLIFLHTLKAEHGLEQIIVEKYYVSNKADSIATDKISEHPGTLPSGSVTYRIYVDMLPGYKFQAVYGIPGHELFIATTTRFFNNEDYGTEVANSIPDRNLPDNTVMLDSWLSVGAASENRLGILKKDDDTSATIVNRSGALQNGNSESGIPLRSRDGLMYGSSSSLVTGFGLDSAIQIFRKKNAKQDGQIFSVTNASWASLKGAVGPTADNRVLIAQITTNGLLSFELNIQIGTPYGGVEQYVAKSPTGEEIYFPALTYSSGSLSVKSSGKGRNTN